MRKIAFLSMVAVLAASCSSDIMELPVVSEGGTQQSGSGISEKINMTVSKAASQIIEDVEFIDAARVYGQFGHELVSRDLTSVLLPQVANVIDSIVWDSVKQMLYIDLGKVSGQYAQDTTQRAWTYSELPGSVKFDFMGIAGDTCTAEFATDSSMVYTLEPTGNIQVKVPYMFKDWMYANGKLVGNGSVKSEIDENSYSYIAERNCGRINTKYTVGSNSTAIGDMSSSSFELKDGIENLIKVVSQDVDNAVEYRIELGSETRDFIHFDISSLDIQEFFSLLEENFELAGPVAEEKIEEIAYRIEEFNYGQEISFSYESADTAVEGDVKLVLREPDEYFDFYRIRIALSYKFEGQEEVAVIEAPVEEIAKIVMDIIEGCHIVAEHYINVQIRFMQIQHEKMVKAMEFYARAIERRIRIFNHIAGDIMDINAEFLRGLDSMIEAFLRNLDSYIDTFPRTLPFPIN